MPAPDWHIILVAITSVLSVFAWEFPLILLTTLAYYIEKYTKFQTKWKLLIAATTLSLMQPVIILYDYESIGDISPLHEALGNTLLLLGITLGAYASLNLLAFQRINTGKTGHVVEILATVGAVIPALAFVYEKTTAVDTYSLVAYDTSIALLVLIFLIIGKTIRNYVPKHGRITYTIVILAAVLLSVNIMLMNYAHLSAISSSLKNALRVAGVALQSTGNLLLAGAVMVLINEARIRGVHIIPASEKKTDNSPMKYRLKKGFGYLISEADGKRGFEVLKAYITHKHHGLGIVRTKPDRIREEYGLRTTPILWMTTAETEYKTIKPTDLERLILIIKDFIANDTDSILLIERLDYLIAENGFEKSLNFIHRLNDAIVSSQCILIVSINLNTLSPEQRNLLSQELEDLSMADKIVLNEALYELLSYTYSENNSGRRPSFKKITDKFNITKTTARKRINELESKGLLRVVADGKFKLLEATQRGSETIKSPVGPKGW